MQRSNHAFTQGDLFHNYDMTKFKFKDGAGTAVVTRKKYKYSVKQVLVAKIFFAFIKLVIKDLIRKGTTFHLPVCNIAMFKWCSITGDEFTTAYQTGKFDSVDFLSTNFTLYFLIFKYFYGGKFREKSIMVDNRLKEEAYEKMNSGFKYC